MYSIAPRIAGNYSLNGSLNALLDSIDAKVALMAQCRMVSLRYDTADTIDIDLYDDLITYKNLLMDKLLGCKCITEQRLVSIVSRIKKLVR